jgi:hypothetical protein
MILLAIGHIIRHKQSSKNLHYYFVLCLICLSVQYICATQDISTAYLTAIADIIAFCLNTRLFLIWYISMEKHIVGRMEISLYVMVAIFKLCFWAIIFMKSSQLACLLFSDNCRGSLELDNPKLTIWGITLMVSISGSSILILLTFLCQCSLGSEKYKGKREKRLQLACLSLLSLLLLASMFGSLFEVPLLYIIPFLLFHTIPILRHDSISSYYYDPSDSSV